MKKLITLLILFVGMVSSVSAQKQTANTIRVGFSDTNEVFTGSHFYIYVFGADKGNDASWPGVDVTENVETINGVSYYYRDFPADTYGTQFSVIAVNDDGSAHTNQKQTVDLNWSYNGTSSDQIQKDTYYNISEEKSGDKYKADLVPMYYVLNTDATRFVKPERSGNEYSATISVSDFDNFIVANSYAFNADGTINWDDNKGYPSNIYRPNWSKPVAFINQEHSTETENWEFNRYFKNGCWDASGLASDVKIIINFTINGYDAVSCSLSPYFTRNITAGYATFSSAYDVTLPAGVEAWYAKEVQEVSTGNNRIVMKKFADGIPANTGALLVGSGTDLKFTPATSPTAPGTNLLVATVDETPIAVSTTGAYHYILGNGGAGVGFYNVNEARNSAAGKAYLATTTELTTENANARAAWIFDEEGETTGIAAVKASQKMNGEFFNLAGQRVAQPTKGLYIVNGKKVIMK